MSARQATQARTRRAHRGSGGSSVSLECSWLHVDQAVPATQWHHRDGFKDVVGLFDASRAGDESVTIYLQTYCKTIKLRVSKKASINELKDHVHAREGIPPAAQNLRVNGTTLPGSVVLQACGIEDGSLIDLEDTRDIAWTCLKTTATRVKTIATVFFQCRGSSLDIFCVESNDISLDRLSLEFPEDEEVLDAVNVTTYPRAQARGRSAQYTIVVNVITKSQNGAESVFKCYTFRRNNRADWAPEVPGQAVAPVVFSIPGLGTIVRKNSKPGVASGGSVTASAVDLSYITLQNFAWTLSGHQDTRRALPPNDLVFCECAADRVRVRSVSLSPNSSQSKTADGKVVPAEIDSFQREGLMKSLLKFCWPDRTHLLSSVHRVNNTTIAAVFAMDNDYVVHLLARQQNGKYRCAQISLGRPALGTEFKHICISDPIEERANPHSTSNAPRPTYRLCAVTNRQILVYPLVWVEEERPAVDVLGFGIGRSGQTTLKLGLDPADVIPIPWMSGWNSISSVRMGSDKRLWLIAEQDPRPRPDRARHMTSQVYWTDVTGSRRARHRFVQTEPLPRDDLLALRANRNKFQASRYSLGGVRFGGLDFSCCCFGSSISSFVVVDEQEFALPHCGEFFKDVVLPVGADVQQRRPSSWPTRIQQKLVQLQRAHHRHSSRSTFAQCSDLMLEDDVFQGSDDGLFRYQLHVIARRLVRDTNDRHSPSEEELCQLPLFLKRALPWSSATDMDGPWQCDARFVGVFISLALQVLSAHASLLQALCAELVYRLHVSANPLQQQDRELMGQSLLIASNQLYILMLCRRALRQQHQRDGRNLTNSVGRQYSSNANGVWAPNSVSAAEAFLRNRFPNGIRAAVPGSRQHSFVGSMVASIVSRLLPIQGPGIDRPPSLDFLLHLKLCKNFSALRTIRRRLFTIRTLFDQALDAATFQFDLRWTPWMPTFKDTMHIIPIGDEIGNALCWSPESIFDASMCFLRHYSHLKNNGKVDQQHLDDFCAHFLWLRTMLRIEVDGKQKALEPGTLVLFPARHVEAHKQRGLVDGYGVNGCSVADRNCAGTASQFRVVVIPTDGSPSDRSRMELDSDVRRNVVRPIRRFVRGTFDSGRPRLSDFENYMTRSYSVLYQLVREARGDAASIGNKLERLLLVEEIHIVLFSEQRGSHRFIDAVKLIPQSQEDRAQYPELRSELHQKIVEEIFYADDLGWIQELLRSKSRTPPRGSDVAEELLTTCEKEWLKKIAEEGRPTTSGAGTDMELKNSTLQHLFRLCCKTYALREQQAAELSQNDDAAKKLEAAAIFMEKVAEEFHQAALGIQRIPVGTGDVDKLGRVLATCFDRQRFALLAAVNAWRKRFHMLPLLQRNGKSDGTLYVRVPKPTELHQDFGRCLNVAEAKLKVVLGRARYLARQTDSDVTQTLLKFLKEDDNRNANIRDDDRNADISDHGRTLRQALAHLAPANVLATRSANPSNVAVPWAQEIDGQRPMVALYFGRRSGDSACIAFVERLKSTYRRIKESGLDANKPFHVVFVSRDETEDQFRRSCADMPESWLAVPFRTSYYGQGSSVSDIIDLREMLHTTFCTSRKQVPACVLVDPWSGKVLCSDARGAIVEDPEGHGYPWGESLQISQALAKQSLFSAAVGVVNDWATDVRQRVAGVFNGPAMVRSLPGGRSIAGHEIGARTWVRRQTLAILRYLTQLSLQLPKRRAATDASERLLQDHFLPLALGQYAPDYSGCTQAARVSTLWHHLSSILSCSDSQLSGEASRFTLHIAELVAKSRLSAARARRHVMSAADLVPLSIRSLFVPPPTSVDTTEQELLRRILAPFSSQYASSSELLHAIVHLSLTTSDSATVNTLMAFARYIVTNVFVAVASSSKVLLSRHGGKLDLGSNFGVLTLPYSSSTLPAYDALLRHLARSSVLPESARAQITFARGTVPTPLLRKVADWVSAVKQNASFAI